MSLQAQLATQTAQIVELEQMLEEAMNTLEHRTNQLGVMEGRMMSMQSTMRGLEASQKTRDQEIDAVRYDAAQDKVRLQRELERLRQVNQDQQQELTRLHEGIDNLGVGLGEISQDSCGLCDELQCELDETKDQLAHQLHQLEAASNERLQLQYQMDYCQREYDPRMVELETAKLVADKDSDRLALQLSELNNERENLQHEVAVLRGQLLATEELAGTLQGSPVGNQLQRSTIAAPTSDYCIHCANLQAQLDEARNQLNQQYVDLEAISVEKLHLQQKMDIMSRSKQPGSLASEVAKLAAEKDAGRLRKRASDLERVNEELRQEMIAIGRQLESLCGRLLLWKYS